MNNEEKARLLVDLFPEMKTAILETIEQVANYAIDNGDKLMLNWNNPFISYRQWNQLAGDIIKVLQRSKGRMIRSNREFCALLYLGYRGVFTNDCILRVASSDEFDKEFRAVAHALFCIEPCYELISKTGYETKE